VDRDASDTDETIQKANRSSLGLDGQFGITRRETTEPVFAHVPDAAAWQAELVREARKEDLHYLRPIPTVQSGLPSPKSRNFGVDTDGDGRLDAFLDPGHATIPLDADSFHYAGLFPDGYGDAQDPRSTGYARYMSRVERKPYNQIVDYMLYSGVVPPEQHPLFPGWTAGNLDSMWRGEGADLNFGDPLHQFYQVTRAFRGDLNPFFSSGEFVQILRDRATVTLPDAAAFAQAYPVAANPFQLGDRTPWLRLEGVVLIEKGPLELGKLRFLGSGTILVGSGDLIVGEIAPSQDSMPSFVALDGDIRLRGSGTHTGFYAAPRGQLRNEDGTPKHIAGALAVGTLRAPPLENGGSIQYDSSGDLSHYRGGTRSAYADHYWAALSASPLDWEILP
jgi:hypothetical protein